MSIPWSSGTIIAPSAVRTTTFTSADIPVAWANVGIDVIFDLSVNAGSSASLTVTINGKDPASGKYYPLLAGAAVTSVGTNVYRVGSGFPATTNVSANCGVPSIIQIVVAAGNASPATYSVGLNMIS